MRFFVELLLEEVPEKYWEEELGTANPTFDQVLEMLVRREDPDLLDDDPVTAWLWHTHLLRVYDFTLPGDVTDLVMAVYMRFGFVFAVKMES